LKISQCRNLPKINTFPYIGISARKKVRNESTLFADNYYVGTMYRGHERFFKPEFDPLIKRYLERVGLHF
jgi:hypothetical protein